MYDALVFLVLNILFFPQKKSPDGDPFPGRAELGRPDRNESGCAKELPLEGAFDGVRRSWDESSICRQTDFATGKNTLFFGGGEGASLKIATKI